jgi:hypothetical protein
MAKRLENSTDMYIAIRKYGIYGYVNFSYDSVNACLDLELVKAMIYTNWQDSIVENSEYSTYSSGHGWVTLHNYGDMDCTDDITYTFNFETLKSNISTD